MGTNKVKEAYDVKDHELNSAQLDDKYNTDGDGEHPYYVKASWREAVGAQQTLVGYWDWVAYQISTDKTL